MAFVHLWTIRIVCPIFLHATILHMVSMSRRNIATLLVTAFFCVPLIALAAGIPSQIVPSSCHGVDCKCSDLVALAGNILTTAIYLSVFVSAILFAWAGWKMLTGKAMGESEQIGDAKKVLWNVTIGLVIILAAWLIIDTILRSLTTLPVWNTICR